MWTRGDILGYLKCVPLAIEADVINPRLVRVSTALKYPDGSNIDVFVQTEADTLDFQHAKVTDLGNTFEWLSNVSIRPWQSARRRAFVKDVVETLNVNYDNGEIFKWITSDEHFTATVFNVAQAALRVSDLLFTQRLVRATDFQEVFVDYLQETELSFAEQITVNAPNGKDIVIPYEVYGKTKHSWVQLLSTRSSNAAHRVSVDTFIRWFDLRNVAQEIQRVTVFDDQYDLYKEPDLSRFEELSEVIPWSEQSTLTETLRQ